MGNETPARIGIDLGGTKIEGVALLRDGREAARLRVPSPQGDYGATIAAIADLVAELEARTPCDRPVGVGIPGALSPASGRVKNANSTWLIGHALDADLSKRMNRPVRLANDANCFVLSEATDGAAREYVTAFGAILGTGVGGGLVVRQQILDGANAIAGEWGHNPLPWPQGDEQAGPSCYCGKTGCIETFLSGPGLAADHHAATGRQMTADAIAAQAADGEPACTDTMARYVDRLARGLASVINVFDPEVVVLGGGLSNIDTLYREVPAQWGDYVFSDAVTTRLVRALHGDASGVRGAARLWDAADQQSEDR